MNLRTQAATPLPENIAGSWSMVSPDRSMFVYGRDDSLFVANVDGSNERRLTSSGGGLGGWSPDGSMVTYESSATGQQSGNVFVVDVASGESTQLTHLGPVALWADSTVMEPSFGPGGTTVIFHLARPSTPQIWDVWSVPITGGEPTIVRRDAGWARYSPDGRTLAFMTQISQDGGRTMIADAAGGPAQELVSGDRHSPPIWSPDGTRIAFLASAGVNIIVVATGDHSIVTQCGGPIEWFDDHTLILGSGGC